MAERIKIENANLAKREQQAIDDLNALFPDGNIAGLDNIDRALGKRLSALYRAIGYESRMDMMEAWGFYSEGSKGGRPATFDPEELLSELASRYEGMPKPESLGRLNYENPDLKGNLKTLQNMSVERYGLTFMQLLKDRGILENKRTPSDVMDEELEQMLDKLAGIYVGVADKPTSIKDLSDSHPEYEVELKALGNRSASLYGDSAKNVLVQRGILRKPKNATADLDEEALEEALNSLGAILADAPNEDKPKSINDLASAYPEWGDQIKAGKKAGLIDKEPLQKLGILQSNKAFLKREGIRKVPVETLVADCKDLSFGPLVLPGEPDAMLLAPYVKGVDLESGLELRETVVSLSGTKAEGLATGDTLKAVLTTKQTEWGQEYEIISMVKDNGRKHIFEPVYVGNLFEGFIVDGTSELFAHAGAEVVSRSGSKAQAFAQVKVRYVAKLRRETLAWVLKEKGIVIDNDVRGGMGWRYRLRKATAGYETVVTPADVQQPTTNVALIPQADEQTEVEESPEESLREDVEDASAPEESASDISASEDDGVSAFKTPDAEVQKPAAVDAIGKEPTFLVVDEPESLGKPAEEAVSRALKYKNPEVETADYEFGTSAKNYEAIEIALWAAAEAEASLREEEEQKRQEEERRRKEEEERKHQEERVLVDKEERQSQQAAGEPESLPTKRTEMTEEERSSRIKLLIIDLVGSSGLQKYQITDGVLELAGKSGLENVNETEVEREFETLVADDRLSVTWGMHFTNTYCSRGMISQRYRWHLEHPGQIPDDVSQMSGIERAKLAHEQMMAQYRSIKNNKDDGKFILDNSSEERRIVDKLLDSGGGVSRAELALAVGESGLGADYFISRLRGDSMIITEGDYYSEGCKFFLWTQHDVNGKPMQDKIGSLVESEKQFLTASSKVPDLRSRVEKMQDAVEGLQAELKKFGLFGGGQDKKNAKQKLAMTKKRLDQEQQELAKAEQESAKLAQIRGQMDALAPECDEMKNLYRWY